MSNTNHYSEQFSRNKVTILSFFCSIMVIYIHSYNLTTYNINSSSYGFSKIVFEIENFGNNITTIAVPMFFFISGFLFFRTFEIHQLLCKWNRRIKSIILPYIVWCTIYYLYFVIGTNLPATKSLMNHETVHLSFLEWASWLWINEYYTLWFLKNLIVFIILAPFIWFLLKNHLKIVPTGFIILISLVIVLKIISTESVFVIGLTEYLVGSYIGINHKAAFFYKNKVLSWVSFSYIILMCFTSFKYLGPLTDIALIFALWFFLDIFKGIKNFSPPWWMTITFFTYVSHDLLLESFESIFYISFGSSPIFALLDYLFMPLLVELILICIANIIKKFLPILWRILSGDRIYTR